ncbi:MAG: hypothetical protein KZQ82_03395 [Candidatus Thiodiazotropha sp. (ex Lucinoma annulata)]|nr:hypothetical protein [Candidatus Thiodiazotropha sp. (ex Lucinoma annulata)]
MIPGRQVLASIDQSVNKAHSKIDEFEGQIEAISGQLADQQQAITQDYRELASTHLDWLIDGEMERQLDKTEHQVKALFAQRHEVLSALQREIRSAEDAFELLAAKRTAQVEQVDHAAKVVDDAEAETQARLDQDPDYRHQREKAEVVERKAMHAGEKASRSEGEREQKGDTYRNDPLFMYLWQRNYGLPAYKASGLVRWLDGKVAHLIGFADARANFTRLKEIPERLREHATTISRFADEAFAALKVLDEAAREADGILLLEKTLEESQTRLDEIDSDIGRHEANYQRLLSQKAEFATGDDEFTQKAVTFLAAEFKRDDLMALRNDALNTPFPDDDLIISRMLDREDQRLDLESAIDGFKETIGQHQQRLSELEALRMDFKRNRYDRMGSTFTDDSVIGTVLTQFFAGMLDRGVLWKVLQQQQRYRPRRSNPNFGSGGFGRGTVWNGGIGDILGDLGRSGFPGGRGGGGGFGRGRRGGGGGFRTGGGF